MTGFEPALSSFSKAVVTFVLALAVMGCAGGARHAAIVVRPDSVAQATLVELNGRRAELAGLLAAEAHPSPSPTQPGAAGSGLTLAQLDSLSGLVSARLKAGIDSFPSLENVVFHWSDRAGQNPESLLVRFVVTVQFTYRNPVRSYSGGLFTPSRAAAEADIFEVASQLAPRLFECYPSLEVCEFSQDIEVYNLNTLRVPRAAAEACGTNPGKYSANATRTWRGRRLLGGGETMVLVADSFRHIRR